MQRPGMAKTLQLVAEQGVVRGFYSGELAEAIGRVIQQSGGVLSSQDLQDHADQGTEFRESISVEYHGLRVHEVPPPTQGLAALQALRLVDGLVPEGTDHNSATHLHLQIEAMRLAFADAQAYIADEQVAAVPVAELLSEQYLSGRRALVKPDVAAADAVAGTPPSGCDTVQV